MGKQDASIICKVFFLSEVVDIQRIAIIHAFLDV